LIDEISPEERASAHEDLRLWHAPSSGLPPRCREVFWLRRVEDPLAREVAARLGIREGMVEKHVAKAMRRFADALFGGRRMRSRRKTQGRADGEHEHVEQQTD